MRKRLFNSIQDMKGKIRVFCRVRPMLDFEVARSQNIAIFIPDQFTASHFWKDDKKAREYHFDQVRAASCKYPMFTMLCDRVQDESLPDALDDIQKFSQERFVFSYA
jgi:hypothetical protein